MEKKIHKLIRLSLEDLMKAVESKKEAFHEKKKKKGKKLARQILKHYSTKYSSR